MKHIYTLLSTLLLCAAAPLAAQHYITRPLPTQKQLPITSIHCIMEDAEGYMWYGTEGGGLCRDDGYRIEVFRPNDATDIQAASRVHSICEGHGGKIYFGTSNGLFCVDKKDYSVRRAEADTSALEVGALYADSRGRVWIGRKGTIGIIDTLGRTTHYPCRVDGEATSAVRLCEDLDGTVYALLWPARRDGRPDILRLRRGEKEFASLHWPIGSTPIQMIEDRQQQCYWVLTSGAGIVRMTIEGDHCRTEQQPATATGEGQRIGLSLLRDSHHGLLWCTTLDNLYAYSISAEGTLQPFPLSAFLPDGNKILDQLYESRDGTIYVSGYTPSTFMISSAQNELKRLATPAIRLMTGYPLLADRSVSEGRYIWIWQGRKGLVLYDSDTDQATPMTMKYDRTMQRSSLGGIWVSNGSTVYRLWQTDGNVQSTEIMNCKRPVCALYEDQQQGLWIATDQTLIRHSVVSHQQRHVADLPTTPLGIAADRQGTVYLALGAQGLYRATTKGALERIDQTQETFLAVATAPDGSLWASTFGGNVYHYTPTDGALALEPRLCTPNGVSVKDIHTDGLGHVWALTDQMVCEYAPQSRAYRIIHNTDPFVDVSYFYTLETVSSNSMAIDGAGAIIEVQSSPELSLQAAADVRPIASAVSIGGATRFIGQGTDRLRLKADEQDLAIHLTTLDHRHAGSISFAYLMEGESRDWVYLPQGTSTIILTNLEKGRHRLHVMASDPHGCWSVPEVILTLMRDAHWYETWWARLLCLVLVLAVAYAVWQMESRISLLRRLIRRRREVRLDEIELKRDDIASAKRDDELLRRAIAKVEENLSRTDYNVSALSDDMCMSRITLYRRIQELTGQSPIDFIRDIRLKKAAQLLRQNPEATLADIARKVGFATPKYFSKCFREKFGMLPRDYASAPTPSSPTDI